MLDHSLQLPQAEPKEVSAATTLMPYRKDDARARYLGYLACGFSDEEALFVLGLNTSWLEQNRRDDKFADLEIRMPEIRKELSREYTELDFYRNFRMVLEKDHRILRKSLDMEIDPVTELPVEMTPYDQQYLLRLRSAYTPQQLQLLEAVTAGGDGGFNFAKWVEQNQEVVQVSRTDTISLARRQGGEKTDNS